MDEILHFDWSELDTVIQLTKLCHRLLIVTFTMHRGRSASIGGDSLVQQRGELSRWG